MRRLLVLAVPLGVLAVLEVVGACGTLGELSETDAAVVPVLPSAGVGPFRALAKGEVLGTAPFVLDGAGVAPFREPSALPVDPSDATSMSVFLYVVAIPPPIAGVTPSMNEVIARTRADDARSFYGTVLDPDTMPAVVLSASLPWEGDNLTGPSALWVGSEVYLYYASAGGIGLARSSDGLSFEKEPSPVLARDPSVRWETTAPAAPSVAELPDGSFDMMYAAGLSIGEAVSQDGVHFTRVDADPTTAEVDPVLTPLGYGAVASLSEAGLAEAGASLPFDMAQVADPCVLPTTSPAGRFVVRVLYTGYDGAPGAATRSSAIGLAARFGTTGPLVRQPQPTFSIDKMEAAPTLFVWSGGEMLYVHANAGNPLAGEYPAIAAGVAPTEVTFPPLPDGGAYPASP